MNAPPVLFLPGLLCDAALFAPQLAALAGTAELRVADLTRGETMTALARAALDQAPWPRFAIAGLSMGGYAAHEMLRLAPQRIAGVALLDTSARPETPEATANRERLMALAERDFPAVIDTLLPKFMHPDHVADARLAGTVRDMALRIGPEVFPRQERAIISRADSRAGLARIACPAVVITGAEDALITREMHAEQAEGIPGAKLVVIPHCGHLSTLEQPAAVNDALREWLARMA